MQREFFWSFLSRCRSALPTVLRIAVSIGLLAFIARSLGIDTIADGLTKMDPRHFLLALFLSIIGILVSAWKWKLILDSKKIHQPFTYLLSYYYIGQFFNAFMPTAVGGDSARMFFLYRDSDVGVDSFSSVFVERIAGLLSIFLIGAVAAIFSIGHLPRQVTGIVLLAAFTGTAGLLTLFFTDLLTPVLDATVFKIGVGEIGNRAASLYESIHEYRGTGRILFVVLGISVVIRLANVVINYVLALGLGLRIPFVYFLIFIPITELLLFIPVSIQGFGVREASYAYLFGVAGATMTGAVTLGIVMQILRVANNLIGGCVYIGYSLVYRKSLTAGLSRNDTGER